jgi:hypothetical protein
MQNLNINRAFVRFLAIASILITSTSIRAAYPGWNNDVDDRNGNPWVGYGGTLHYVVYDLFSDRNWILRWPPPPGETDPMYDQLMAVFNVDASPAVLAVHDGALYATGTGISNISNGFESSDVHGIAKIDLLTLQPSDPVSVTPPLPNIHAIVWDHNGTMYVAGSTATLGHHYDTNMFMKWTGSSWVGLGGGIEVNNDDQSFVLCMATDGTNIFLGGTFLGYKQSNNATNSAVNILCYNVDTGLYSAMSTGLFDAANEGAAIVQTMAIGGTNLFVTGTFTNSYSSDNSDGGIARFDTIYRNVQPFGTVARSSVTGVASLNNDAYIVGHFDNITNGTVSSISGVARWSPNTGSWSALGTGINSYATSVTKDANSVFVSGSFTTAGGLTCNQCARWQVAADSTLQFTSGSLSGTSVNLNLSGIPNLDCDVERLNFSTDSWVRQGSLKLDASGTGTFGSSVLNGLGYFRARSRDGSDRYLSTNAFGSIVGTIPAGNWLVGTPFAGMTITNTFPTPYDGTTVYYFTNGNFQTLSYSSIFGEWSDSDRALAAGEGVLVYSAASGTNTLAYRAYGLFSENSFSRTLPSGYSMITSPLFHKYSGGSATQIDEFNSTRLGGYSLVPVNSSSNPKAYASRNKTGASNDYINYTLTSGGQWETNSVNTTVPILIGESVWLDNLFGSAQTWSVSLPIW